MQSIGEISSETPDISSIVKRLIELIDADGGS